MGGAKGRYLLITLIAGIAAIAAVFAVDELLKYQQSDGTWEYRLLKNYQRSRLLVFLNPEGDLSGDGYNLAQAKIAIGSGGLFGKGIGNATQSTHGFLPEAPTDFIFCVLAEEFGFVGVMALIGLYALLIVACLSIARRADNLSGMLIVMGVVGMWLFQILENIGMDCGLMPITGIPLPFVSYGSSFMVVNFALIGLIGSVYSHTSTQSGFAQDSLSRKEGLMNLPLDIPALLKAATDIDEARNTPLAVSVYIDETAPGDVVGHVRSAFASAGAKTRVTIGYLDDNLLAEPYGADDMAVIVAGDSPRIGEQAAHIRGAGMPVMVATTAPRAVAAAAEAAGWPVPEGDIVAPNMTNPTPFGDAARALARRITAGSTASEAPNAAAARGGERGRGGHRGHRARPARGDRARR